MKIDVEVIKINFFEILENKNLEKINFLFE